MPRCLMAKKWKAYPWPDRADDPTAEDDDEEIDVVGDSNVVVVAATQQHNIAAAPPAPCWGPSSPTAGATAPSPPPPHSPEAAGRVSTIIYNGYIQELSSSHFSTYARNESPSSLTTSLSSPQPSYVTLHTARELRRECTPPPPPPPVRPNKPVCVTSTGAALPLPPKKKDIYRPYSLDDRPKEDLHAAHAILDLSASTAYAFAPLEQRVIVELPPLPQPSAPTPASVVERLQPSPVPAQASGKTVAYTYEAFFVSDGRSKRAKDVQKQNTTRTPQSNDVPTAPPPPPTSKPKYTCTECGKQYATSSNLSRHKQTHRSLDSQSAKKCMTCGKAYVSMPALAMHVLTHKLAHSCGVCGKLFSRPWLLQGHLRSHTGEKPYGCAHCGKAFADRSNLRAHMQTHSHDKNFECTRCRKSFALKSYLNKHLESACLKDDKPASVIATNMPVGGINDVPIEQTTQPQPPPPPSQQQPVVAPLGPHNSNPQSTQMSVLTQIQMSYGAA